MTSLSRRAFATGALATLASLVAGCGEPGGGGSAPASRRRRRTADTPASAPTAPTTPAPSGRSEPVALRIPAIGVDTPLMRLGLASDGTVEVPPIAKDDRAGWYAYSPPPGQAGPSVILGHVTVGEYGDGVFRHLGELRQGDRIVTRLESGGTPEFEVSAVRKVAKADFPTDEVYGNVRGPELRLITCGGPRMGDGYRDNVIVFARLRPTGS